MELKTKAFLTLFSFIIGAIALLSAKFYLNAPDPDAGVIYYIINRDDQHRRQVTKEETEGTPSFLNIKDDSPFFIIIHGYTESSFREWIHAMVHALLEAEQSASVLLVDHWNFLSFSRPLMDDNVEIISRDVAKLIDELTKTSGLRMKNVHLIGFSLGGRIAGVIPHYLKNDKKMGRITGIDPAYPWKDTDDTSQFLDEDDAQLVVTIRTSSVSTKSPAGHVDFWVNGGGVQPECMKWWYPEFIEQICSHYKSLFLFTSALRGERNSSSCRCSGLTVPPVPETCLCSDTNSFDLHTNIRIPGVFYTTTKLH